MVRRQKHTPLKRVRPSDPQPNMGDLMRTSVDVAKDLEAVAPEKPVEAATAPEPETATRGPGRPKKPRKPKQWLPERPFEEIEHEGVKVGYVKANGTTWTAFDLDGRPVTTTLTHTSAVNTFLKKEGFI